MTRIDTIASRFAFTPELDLDAVRAAFESARARPADFWEHRREELLDAGRGWLQRLAVAEATIDLVVRARASSDASPIARTALSRYLLRANSMGVWRSRSRRQPNGFSTIDVRMAKTREALLEGMDDRAIRAFIGREDLEAFIREVDDEFERAAQRVSPAIRLVDARVTTQRKRRREFTGR